MSFGSPEPSFDDVGNRLAYIMLDWEVYEGRLGGRLTRDEIAAQCLSFPAWFCAQLFAHGFVDADRVVTVVLKQKSRPVDGPDVFKHSIHAIVECCGVPAAELSQVCAEVFRLYRADLDACQRQKSYDSLSDEALRSPWIGADLQTMNGKTAFAVLFSKKNRADPGPRLLHRAAFGARGSVLDPLPFKPSSTHEGAATLPRSDALRLLFQSCFTVPSAYIAPLTPLAEALARNQQNRTVSKHHAVSEGGGPPPPLGRSVLPKWLVSVLDMAPGYVLRQDAAVPYFKNIQACKKDMTLWAAVHVSQGGMPCPASLSMNPPVKHQHRNNGVIVVFNPASDECVYARCTSCRLSKELNPHVSLVVSATGTPTQWIRLDRPAIASLLGGVHSGMRPVCMLYEYTGV